MNDKNRMLQWVALAAVFYFVSIGLSQVGDGGIAPQLQTLCWKLGNITIAAFLGYKIDVHASRKRINEASTDLEHIRRALTMAAAMIGVSLGL